MMDVLWYLIMGLVGGYAMGCLLTIWVYQHKKKEEIL